ncbi:hypothetical protein C7441_11062 [Pseudaminobacter salicylatoxidans]|uniref:Uncharacterized protein n=1 Tax=Pseudaminobacter salicylatoxidans TaxID=93369 RepID=A0A316C0K3_PSESE|nr:hypothetical protein [Pseudaminobacter salicylatoxidans]PWJ81530.1 hypothetical protein C7441_11062 [Pseudaminobacter salicylatoxidans]
MGEAKRRRERMTPIQTEAENLTHKLADEGLLIKAGFVGYMAACFPTEQPSDMQRRELEQAFMAGALHLFSSIMVFLDGGEVPTARDLRRMGLIDTELREYGQILEGRAAMAAKTEGSA